MNIIKRISILCLFLILIVQCKPAKQSTSIPMTSLENTYWKLAEMNGQPLITPADSKEVHMVLSSEGSEKRIKGFAGCNSIGGSYTLDGRKIKFITISTKMFCQDRMEVENYFLTVLNQADSYTINGETLELFQGGTSLTSFKAVYLK